MKTTTPIKSQDRRLACSAPAQASAAGSFTAEQFTNTFEAGIRFFLVRAGIADPKITEEILASANGRVTTSQCQGLNEMTLVVRQEVMARIASMAVKRPVNRQAVSETRLEALKSLLHELPANQSRALTDYYASRLSERDACEKHSLSVGDFASIRSSLRVAMGRPTPKLSLAASA